MQELKDDILERTQQMKSLCHDAETTAIQTVVTLADQSEQLDNMKSSLRTMDITLIDTKQNINRLKGLTQRVIDTFRTKLHRKFPFKVTLNSNKKSISASSSLPRRVSRYIIIFKINEFLFLIRGHHLQN
jgi:chromosomal replication initiation ATPase DnaA